METLLPLFDTYAPASISRFHASTGSYAAQVQSGSATLHVKALLDPLPEEVPELFEQGYFADYSNALLLNAQYVAQGRSYAPHIIAVADAGADAKQGQESEGGTAAQGIRCFPNPFEDAFNFQLEEELIGEGMVELQLFDLQGRMLRQEVLGEARDGQWRIDASSLPAGMLIYQLRIGEESYRGKLMHLK